jgi:hypothetical protein
MAADDKTFGSCCETLKDAMSEQEYPLISVGDDGVLCLSVGMTDVEEEEPSVVEYPLFFCPFCGTRLQTQEEVDAKGGGQS